MLPDQPASHGPLHLVMCMAFPPRSVRLPSIRQPAYAKLTLEPEADPSPGAEACDSTSLPGAQLWHFGCFALARHPNPLHTIGDK
jgi:hypothetical protein